MFHAITVIYLTRILSKYNLIVSVRIFLPSVIFCHRSGNKSDSDEEDTESKKFKSQLGSKLLYICN